MIGDNYADLRRPAGTAHHHLWPKQPCGPSSRRLGGRPARCWQQLPQYIPDLLRQSPYRDHRDLRRTNPAARARCTHLLRQDRKVGRHDDRTGDRTRERGRTSVAARSGRTSVRPTRVVHRGGRAVPHRRGHREVLRADLPDLADYVGMDARRRTRADRTRPPRHETARLPRHRDRRPGLPEVLAELAAARADEMDADTVNRELSIARKAIGWWQRQGWIDGDPTIGIERRPAPPDRTKALAENQITAHRRAVRLARLAGQDQRPPLQRPGRPRRRPVPAQRRRHPRQPHPRPDRLGLRRPRPPDRRPGP